jgi:hypothetical protein
MVAQHHAVTAMSPKTRVFLTIVLLAIAYVCLPLSEARLQPPKSTVNSKNSLASRKLVGV